MEQADGLIIATTTFNLRETALLKNFLDHFNYMLHRPHFFTKKALIITTVGGIGGKNTIKSIKGTLQGMGFNKCYGLCITSLSWNAYLPDQKAILKTKNLTKEFYNDILHNRLHFPSNVVLIPYNLFRGMCVNYAPGTEYETQDGIYWTNPQRIKRIYDKRIPLRIEQKIFGSLFYFIGKVMGKKLMITYKK